MNKNLTATQKITERSVEKFLNGIFKWIPRAYLAEAESDMLFYEYPEDQNLKVKHHEDFSFIADLSEYYEEQLKKVHEQFLSSLKLIKVSFEKDRDLDWFMPIIYYIVKALDPYFDKFYTQDSSLYYEPLADLIIEVLEEVDVEEKDKILTDVYSDYLNLENNDMYTYTFAIVIDEMLGKRKFNDVYRKRLILELNNFELDNHTRKFYKEEISRLNKELSKRSFDETI